jgi:hypothetical protein
MKNSQQPGSRRSVGAASPTEHYWVTNEQLKFHPGSIPSDKPSRYGKYVKLVREDKKDPGMSQVEVLLRGDPFTIVTYQKQIQPMEPQSPSETESENDMTASRTPNAKELRRIARENDIEGYETMTLADLRKAVAALPASDEAPAPRKRAASTSRTRTKSKAVEPEPEDELEPDEDEDLEDDSDDEDIEPEPAPRRRSSAKKATPAKKAPAKKAASKAASKKAAAAEPEVANENGNPFKPGTNMYELTELLIAGGKRSSLVAKAKRKITLQPRTEKTDWNEESELDRRLLITGQILAREHGFNVVRDGRGTSATIVAEPPA